VSVPYRLPETDAVISVTAVRSNLLLVEPMETHLTFHGLGPPGAETPADEVPYWVPVEKFKLILDLIKRTDATTHITFDDCNNSDVEIALPALIAAGLRASFFIVSGRVGKPGYLRASDICSLRDAKMEIGSHGAEHIRWTNVSDFAISEDVGRSFDVLRSIINEEVLTVAVPFGAYDLRVLRALKALGVQRVYTSNGGPAPRNAWVVPRTSITANTPIETVRGLIANNYSPLAMAKSALRMWWKTPQAHVRSTN
jgi:peptidoglycan/xylan/chitin deacetylase (PgdA/CDA1 family)